MPWVFSKAMREILLAGDTNRLVAELTFVSRIFFILGFWKFIGVGSLLVGSRYKGSTSIKVYISKVQFWEFGSCFFKQLFGLFEVIVKDSSFEVQTQSSIRDSDYASKWHFSWKEKIEREPISQHLPSVKIFYILLFCNLSRSFNIQNNRIRSRNASFFRKIHEFKGPWGFPKFSGSHQWFGSTTWTHASTHVTWKIVWINLKSRDSGCPSSNQEQV